MNVVKRIIFEVLFVILLCVLMPIHYIHAFALLTYEVFRIYPKEIHNLTIGIVYGKKDS